MVPTAQSVVWFSSSITCTYVCWLLRYTLILGRSAVQAALDSPPSRKLVRLELTAAAPPSGTALLTAAGETVGTVTSAAASVALGKTVALGYVRAEGATELFVAVGDSRTPVRLAGQTS